MDWRKNKGTGTNTLKQLSAKALADLGIFFSQLGACPLIPLGDVFLIIQQVNYVL